MEIKYNNGKKLANKSIKGRVTLVTFVTVVILIFHYQKLLQL